MSVATLSRGSFRAERAAVTAVFFAVGTGIGTWAAVIPAAKARLLLSDGALSLALLGFAGGAVIAMPLAGLIASRFGAARTTKFGLLAFGGTLLLPSLAGTLPMLVAAAFLLGLANGTVDVSMNAQASEVELRWHAAIMSSFHAAFSGGGLAGATLGAVLGGAAPDAAALLAGIVAALAWPALLDKGGATSAGTGLMLPGFTVLPLCAAALLCMLCEGAMADWSAVYLATTTGVVAGATSAGYAAFSATMLCGRLAGDRAVRAVGRARVVAWGGATAAAGFALAVLFPSWFMATIGFALVGVGLSNVVPAIFSAAGGITASPAAGVAMASTAGYGGFLIGPVVIGAVAQASGLRTGVALLIACAGIVALLARAVRNRM